MNWITGLLVRLATEVQEPEWIPNKCLRQCKLSKDCLACQGGCQYKAIEIVGEKVFIDGDRCRQCGTCIYLCPAHAIIYPSKILEKSFKGLKENNEPVITCSLHKNTGDAVFFCFHKMPEALLLILLLEHWDKTVYFNALHCSDCVLVRPNLADFELALSRAIHFCKHFDLEIKAEILIENQRVPRQEMHSLSRRDMLRDAKIKSKEAVLDASQELIKKKNTRWFPLRERLISGLKYHWAEKKKALPSYAGVIASLDVTKDCTGCGACIKACPWSAWTLETDEKAARLSHDTKKCCFCGRCQEVCRVEAILEKKINFHTLDQSVDRKEWHYRSCKQCRRTFLQIDEQEKRCDSCLKQSNIKQRIFGKKP